MLPPMACLVLLRAVARATQQLQLRATLQCAALFSISTVQPQQLQHRSSSWSSLRLPPAWQHHQHQRCYHRATHSARALTVRLLQQQRWQDLQLMYDAAGGAQKLNPIQLCALTQTLARLAPPTELLAATERQHLNGFATEVASACVARLHRFDAVGLSNVLSSLSALGMPLQQAQQQQSADSTSSAAGQLDLHGQVLAAATRHVAAANGHACAMLLTALARLQQQQQQEEEAAGIHLPEHHAELWQGLLAAFHSRVQQLTAAGQVNSAAASSICVAASRLSGTLAAARSNTQQEQQQRAAAPSLHQQLRSLLSLTAQQVVQGDAIADSPAAALTQPSRVLYAVAKSWAWPGWPALQGLLQQFAAALAAANRLAPQAELVSASGGARGTGGRGRKRGDSSADASGILALLQQQHRQRPARTQRAASAAAAGDGSNDADDVRAGVAAARRDSLPQVLWAAGRLVEQRLQQQQQQQRCVPIAQELQQHVQLWAELSPVLQGVLEQLRWLGPLQLAQTASGLGKLVQSSTRLLATATAAGNDVTQEAAVAAAQQLQGQLCPPVLQRLQAAHVGRVEALLPLLSLQHRRQLASGYGQLGLAGQQLPPAVRAVFERDAAAAVVVGAAVH